ncbi:autotransporter domain-containing protein, partial [Maritimibacter sp. DP07]
DVASAANLGVIGTMTGAGGVTKSGEGTLVLSGSSALGGTFRVTAGELSVNGTLAAPTLNVQSGASLMGTGGIIGDVAVYGSLAPGNSPGTLTVNGDVTLTSGSTFDVEVDGRTYSPAGGAGSYDRLFLAGVSSVFTAAGTLQPTLRGISGPATNSFDAIIGDRFRIVSTIDNPAGIAGAFDTVVTPAAGVEQNGRFDVIYGSNFVDLVVVADSLETLLRSSGNVNAISAGAGLDAIRGNVGTGNADLDTLFNGFAGFNAAQTSSATLQASGEIHAFALSDTRKAMSVGSKRLMFGATNRLDGHNLWVDATGYRFRDASDRFASASATSNRMFWSGVDFQQNEKLTFGLALGHSSGELDAGMSGQSERTTNMLGIYGYGSSGPFVYDASVIAGRSDIQGSRSVVLTSGTERNSFEARTVSLQAAARAGYRFDISERFVAMPWVAAEMNWTHAPGYKESGSTVTGLTVADGSYHSGVLKAGLDLEGEFFSNNRSRVAWSSSFGIKHTLGFGDPDASRDVSMHGATWNVTEPHDANTAVFGEFGLSYTASPNSTFWANIGLSRSTGQRQEWIASGFSLRF